MKTHRSWARAHPPARRIFLGAIILTLGILSVGPGICANEASEVDTNGNVMGEAAAPGEGVTDQLAS